MKFILIVLALISSSANADWSYINGDANGSQYIDHDKTKKTGSVAKIWTAVDYNQPRQVMGKVFNSVVAQEEYDCNKEIRRTVFVALYEGRMGNGRALMIDSAITAWTPTPPGSSGEMLLNIACEN